METHKADLGDGWTMEPPKLPKGTKDILCPNKCGNLVHVGTTWGPDGDIITAGCRVCRGLYDTVDGKVVCQIS